VERLLPDMLDWSPDAINDLKEIYSYISTYDPDIADMVEDAIIERAEWIALNFPMAGGRVQGLGSDYRQNLAIKDKYRIIYKVLGENSIKIISIRHTKRKNLSSQEIIERTQKTSEF
jgi:addiction module RelE/StbE family toxin